MGAKILQHPATPNAGSKTLMSDERLVDLIASGDTGALGQLYDQYHRDVYAFLCTAVSAYDSDLDDLVHDTFIAVLDSARRFSGKSQVKTWIFGIAVNVGRNYIRGQVRRRKALGGYPGPTAQMPTMPDEQMHNNRELSGIAEAIAALKPELRMAYVACVLEDLPADEVSKILGVRKGTVWSRVHEARNQIRDRIGRSPV